MLHSGGVEYERALGHYKGGAQETMTKKEGVVFPLSQKETGVTSDGHRAGTPDSVTTIRGHEHETGT